MGLGLLLGACGGSADETAEGDPRTDADPATGIGVGGVSAEGGSAPDRSLPGWRLAWADEFNQRTCPDRTKWRFEHGLVRNEELQWYQPENASCHRGVLVIEARRESKPNPNYVPGSPSWRRWRPSTSYTSASMMSKRSFGYGRFEMRGRIDDRWGTWPAFWTVGGIDDWPQSGEIDIMESYKGDVLANVCEPLRTQCAWSIGRQSVSSLGGEAWTDKFHVWAVEWDARSIHLFLDGRLLNRFAVADAVGAGEPNPYIDNRQFLLLSLAVGGANGGNPTNTAFPVPLEVDYVRVYKRKQQRGKRSSRSGLRAQTAKDTTEN